MTVQITTAHLNEFRKLNDQGAGNPVGPEGVDDLTEAGEAEGWEQLDHVSAGSQIYDSHRPTDVRNDYILFRDGTKLVLVADVNGPWGCVVGSTVADA